MTSQKRNFHCIICRSSKFTIIHSYDEPDQYEKAINVSEKEYFRQWVRCDKCGFHFSLYSRSENSLDAIYVSDYRSTNSHWRSESTEDTFKKVIELPDDQSETKKRVKWIKDQQNNIYSSYFLNQNSSLTLLDIGGATGVFAYEFQDDIWNANVIDPSHEGRFIEEFGVKYYQGLYNSTAFKDIVFDLISLVYVIEHLTDPALMLKEIKKNMRKDSLIYIEVPDALCFKFKAKDDDIFNSCHLWMFDPVSLTKLLDRENFQIYSLMREKTIRGHYILKILGGVK